MSPPSPVYDNEKAMGSGKLDTNVDVVPVDQYDSERGKNAPYSRDDGHGNVHDAVFGEMDDKGPNYRNVGWIGSCILMCKANVGLGVLGIPFVFQTLGLVPGLIVILAIEGIVTWSDYVLGNFKLNHPEVYSFADCGRVMFGRVGGEALGAFFCIYMIFVCASGLVSISVSLNAVSMHGTCTAVFMVVASVAGVLCCSIRTLGQITWLGWVGLISILSAILTLTVSVGVQDRPADAPPTGDWNKEFNVVNHPTFAEGISAVAAVIFAASATPTYFGIISEMRDPRRYSRAMFSAQAFVTTFYIVIGVVVYYFCGQYVAYPAMGSAGVLMKRVCYGMAIPGLLVTFTIYSHLPAKYIFIRILRGSKHLTSNSVTHWATWLSCTIGVTLTAYIIGSAIPIFSNLVSFIGAFFCPTMCMIPFGLMWLHDNWRLRERQRTRALKLQAAWAVAVVLIGLFLTVAGTYGAIVAMVNDPSRTSPFSCADNSNSVPS